MACSAADASRRLDGIRKAASLGMAAGVASSPIRRSAFARSLLPSMAPRYKRSKRSFTSGSSTVTAPSYVPEPEVPLWGLLTRTRKSQPGEMQYGPDLRTSKLPNFSP
jgi:hypothetical protein